VVVEAGSSHVKDYKRAGISIAEVHGPDKAYLSSWVQPEQDSDEAREQERRWHR